MAETKPVWIHKAGDAGEREFGLQRCLRCDVVLIDNREVKNGRFFAYGTPLQRNKEGAVDVAVNEPNCKPREQVLADMRRLRDELRLDRNTLDHWNRTHPEEQPLEHNPQLLVMLWYYDAVLAEEADRNIGPRRTAETTEAVH